MSPKKPAESGESGDRSLPARLDPRLGRPGSGGSGPGRPPASPVPGSREPAAAVRPARRGRTRRTTIVTRALAGLLSAVLLSTPCDEAPGTATG